MNTPIQTVELLVVGGGAGGLTAAREGVRRGVRTVLVQDGPPGGDCTFTGCVPSKSLLSAAARGDSFDDAMGHVRSTVTAIAETEDAHALDREGIEIVTGRGRFVSPLTISVGSRTFRSDRIIVATGSRPSMPPIAGLDEIDVLTNENLFELRTLPTRLAIVGGGPIGCEMAQAFADLGSHVTLIERLGHVLPRDDPAAAICVADALSGRGVDVRCGAGVAKVTNAGASGRSTAASVTLDDGSTIEVDALLVAAGRGPVTDGLEPDQGGVRLDDRGHIDVDTTMATSADGVWAIGDVTGHMAFTHAAASMAMVAAANAFRSRLDPRRARFDASTTPWVTYTDPEVAHIGMNESETARIGGRVAYVPFDELDRALTAGRTDGFVKIFAAPRRVIGGLGGGRVVGATIVGPRAGEMINEIALAMRSDLFVGRLAQTVHAYPTWGMAIQEAAAQFFMEHRGRSARDAVDSG